MIDLKTLTLKEKIKLFKDLYKEISSKGINGDTELAHINPFEARLLKMYGGSGTINEETGLEQYFGGGGGGGTTTSTSQTVAEPYGPSTGNLNQILSEAQNIYGRGPSGYVPQSALTLEGLAAQESLARQANTQISDTVAGKYSNPFLSPIIAQAAQDVYTGVNEAYSGVGRTASSPVAQSQVARSVAQTALPYAFNAYESERGRQLQTAQQATSLTGVGQTYEDYIRQQQQAPYQSLVEYANIVNPVARGGTTQTTFGPAPNRLGQAAGGFLAGSALGSQLPSIGGYSGAMYGGLLGSIFGGLK